MKWRRFRIHAQHAQHFGSHLPFPVPLPPSFSHSRTVCRAPCNLKGFDFQMVHNLLRDSTFITLHLSADADAEAARIHFRRRKTSESVAVWFRFRFGYVPSACVRAWLYIPFKLELLIISTNYYSYSMICLCSVAIVIGNITARTHICIWARCYDVQVKRWKARIRCVSCAVPDDGYRRFSTIAARLSHDIRQSPDASRKMKELYGTLGCDVHIFYLLSHYIMIISVFNSTEHLTDWATHITHTYTPPYRIDAVSPMCHAVMCHVRLHRGPLDAIKQNFRLFVMDTHFTIYRISHFKIWAHQM